MKITIEGEPKEIAAYELALKGGSENITAHSRDVIDPWKISKQLTDLVSESCQYQAHGVYRE